MSLYLFDTLDASIAECARVGGLVTAPLFELSAREADEAEARRLEDRAGLVDELRDELGKLVAEVGEPSERAKHTDDCWKRHAPCLLARLQGVLGE